MFLDILIFKVGTVNFALSRRRFFGILIIGGDSSVSSGSGSVYVVCGLRLLRLLVVMVGVIWSLLSGTSIACKGFWVELGSLTN